MVFERAYVQYPVCNASRCSFLTGLRPDQTGVIDNLTQLRSKQPQIVTLPQLFKQQGYYTASFGKIFHVGAVRQPSLRAQWLDFPQSWHEARVFDPMAAGKVMEGRNLTDEPAAVVQLGCDVGTDDDQPDGQNAVAAIQLIEARHGSTVVHRRRFSQTARSLRLPRKSTLTCIR